MECAGPDQEDTVDIAGVRIVLQASEQRDFSRDATVALCAERKRLNFRNFSRSLTA